MIHFTLIGNCLEATSQFLVLERRLPCHHQRLHASRWLPASGNYDACSGPDSIWECLRKSCGSLEDHSQIVSSVHRRLEYKSRCEC